MQLCTPHPERISAPKWFLISMEKSGFGTTFLFLYFSVRKLSMLENIIVLKIQHRYSDGRKISFGTQTSQSFSPPHNSIGNPYYLLGFYRGISIHTTYCNEKKHLEQPLQQKVLESHVTLWKLQIQRELHHICNHQLALGANTTSASECACDA